MAKKAKRAGAKQAKTSKDKGHGKSKQSAPRRAAPKAARRPVSKPPIDLEDLAEGEPPRPPDPRSEFLRLVSKIGAAEAQRLLDTFVEVETPRKPRV